MITSKVKIIFFDFFLLAGSFEPLHLKKFQKKKIALFSQNLAHCDCVGGAHKVCFLKDNEELEYLYTTSAVVWLHFGQLLHKELESVSKKVDSNCQIVIGIPIA